MALVQWVEEVMVRVDHVNENIQYADVCAALTSKYQACAHCYASTISDTVLREMGSEREWYWQHDRLLQLIEEKRTK